MCNPVHIRSISALALALACGAPAYGQPISIFAPPGLPASLSEQVMLPEVTPQDIEEADQLTTNLPAGLRRQVVLYPAREAPGTIVIDTPHTSLYYVLGGGQAIRYGIGVGREGFTWSGVRTIDRKVEWPDWEPPVEMIERQPYLPRLVAGGPGNPLGARAMYLGGTLYRIHGTNEPSTIGQHVSSGCIRMLNEDAIDLYGRVNLGTKVVVLPDKLFQNPVDPPIAPPTSTYPRATSYTTGPRYSAPMTFGFSASGLY